MEVLSWISISLGAAVSWFTEIMQSTKMTSLYLAMIFVLLVGKFILTPIFGAASSSMGSDVVKKAKENSRYHGSFERGNRGKYLKK